MSKDDAVTKLLDEAQKAVTWMSDDLQLERTNALMVIFNLLPAAREQYEKMVWQIEVFKDAEQAQGLREMATEEHNKATIAALKQRVEKLKDGVISWDSGEQCVCGCCIAYADKVPDLIHEHNCPMLGGKANTEAVKPNSEGE